MLCEALHEAKHREVAILKVKDLEAMGKKFPEISPDSAFDEIVSHLMEDQAVLVRQGIGQWIGES